MARAGNVGFAFDELAVVELGFEGYVLRGGGENASADCKDARGNSHGFREIAGDVSERGEEEVAETVAGEAAAATGKAILKEFAEQVLVFRESHHAVADVARRQHGIFAAQAAGAAAVVGDGDDGDEIGDGAELDFCIARPWDAGARGWVRNSTKSLRPRRTMERPVPPPSATMRTGRVRRLELRC